MSSAAQIAPRFEMSLAEKARYARDGYLLRTDVFSRAECAEIARECEEMVDQLTALKRNRKVAAGSYMFEYQDEIDTSVKWEPFAPDLVQGVEPFAHYYPPLKAWGLDARLVDPCKAICDAGEVELFTEKLNLKRARQGGAIILHQDYPYWEDFAPLAHRVATAIVFLDDSTRENGCLEVAPGTHTVGKWPQRTDVSPKDFGSLEMDTSRFDLSRLIPLEVKAGAVAFFGAFLVHRSLPNRSDKDRRALLYSYQPTGSKHSRVLIAEKYGRGG